MSRIVSGVSQASRRVDVRSDSAGAVLAISRWSSRAASRRSGSGDVMSDDVDLEECEECEGTGKGRCGECEGWRVLRLGRTGAPWFTGRLRGNERRCPGCRGSGRADYCSPCRGTGRSGAATPEDVMGSRARFGCRRAGRSRRGLLRGLQRGLSLSRARSHVLTRTLAAERHALSRPSTLSNLPAFCS
ncbi:MAG: hypothetical protein JWO86_7819 [Myxococcaceae bacterium]|nr:hypothetical protein [Myxococcaceae bacterium]